MQDSPTRVLQLRSPKEIRAELERVGADSSLEEKVTRAQFHLVKLERVNLPLARLLYQELLMEGGQVVTAPRLEHVGAGETDVLLCATRYQFNHLFVRLRWQPSEELQWLADHIERALERLLSPPPAMEIGSAVWDWQRTYLMGILNVTPDSFSGDALLEPNAPESENIARVLARARELVQDGADLLDIGGESTHPRATPVPMQVEMQRVLPAVRALKNEIRVPLSIDTSKAMVAQAALDAGAHFVNDVTGLRGDVEMKRVVAAHRVPVVIMHNWLHDARPQNITDSISVIIHELQTQIDAALDAGIAEQNIIVDPGLGFGKTLDENLAILNRLAEFRAFGRPLLIGPSRKGFITKATGVAMHERDDLSTRILSDESRVRVDTSDGTAAAITIGIVNGAKIVRVHDVKKMSRVAKMTDVITNAQ